MSDLIGDQTREYPSVQGSSRPDELAPRTRARRFYLRMLALSFAVFSSLRVVAYLPTLWTIHASGESDQHSLLTWVTWAGANLTMAGWLYEEHGRRMNPAIAVLLCNFGMCGAAVALIVWYRL